MLSFCCYFHGNDFLHGWVVKGDWQFLFDDSFTLCPWCRLAFFQGVFMDFGVGSCSFPFGVQNVNWAFSFVVACPYFLESSCSIGLKG